MINMELCRNFAAFLAKEGQELVFATREFVSINGKLMSEQVKGKLKKHGGGEIFRQFSKRGLNLPLSLWSSVRALVICYLCV